MVVSHGFLSSRKKVLEYTKALARMGYAAYCFDFCGGWNGCKGKYIAQTIALIEKFAAL